MITLCGDTRGVGTLNRENRRAIGFKWRPEKRKLVLRPVSTNAWEREREREREREMEKVGGLRKRWQDGDIRRGISSGYLNSGYSVGEHAESGSFLTEIQGDILLVART